MLLPKPEGYVEREPAMEGERRERRDDRPAASSVIVAHVVTTAHAVTTMVRHLIETEDRTTKMEGRRKAAFLVFRPGLAGR